MPAADGMAETALLTLKARICAYRYRPGARLSPERLARELHIGVTPMRVALAVLHSDGFIDHASRFGYHVRTPSRTDLRGLYLANKILLAGAAGCRPKADPKSMDPARAAIAPPSRTGADSSAATANLFDAVAMLAESDLVARTVTIASERLEFARNIEPSIFPDAQEELSSLDKAFKRKRFEELRIGVERYHDRRLASVDKIADAVFMHAFRQS